MIYLVIKPLFITVEFTYHTEMNTMLCSPDTWVSPKKPELHPILILLCLWKEKKGFAALAAKYPPHLLIILFIVQMTRQHTNETNNNRMIRILHVAAPIISIH